MNSRLKKIREALKLSQQEFSDKIALSRGYLANIELGNQDLNDRLIKLICQEFNVSELWLKTGEGEMFTADSLDILEEIGQKCNLDDDDKAFLSVYLDSNEFERKIIKDFALKIAQKIKESNDKNEVK